MSTPAPQPSKVLDGEVDEPRVEMDPIRKTRFWQMCRAIAYFGSTVLFDYRAFGVKNVPKTGGALMISNHQSYLDPVMLGLNLPRPLSYLAKSELFKNPLLRWLITELRAIPVHQGRSDKAAIEETIRRLRQGHLLSIFPEGSRTETGELMPMQRGAALVVRRAGVPIIPVAIHGSYDAWPKGHKVFRAWPIRVLYGKPMHVEGLKSDQILELMDRTLREMLDDLRARRVAKYLK